MKFILKNPSRILEREAYLNETESRWGNSIDATVFSQQEALKEKIKVWKNEKILLEMVDAVTVWMNKKK